MSKGFVNENYSTKVCRNDALCWCRTMHLILQRPGPAELRALFSSGIIEQLICWASVGCLRSAGPASARRTGVRCRLLSFFKLWFKKAVRRLWYVRFPRTHVLGLITLVMNSEIQKYSFVKYRGFSCSASKTVIEDQHEAIRGVWGEKSNFKIWMI